jgi:hypothetical protein
MRIVDELKERFSNIAITALLPEILDHGLLAAPRVTVELGVSREAIANKILSYVAAVFDGWLVSCDRNDFHDVCGYPKWRFFEEDDIALGRRFDEVRPVGGGIDLLFVDTDERYPHTSDEITTYFPLLSPTCTVMFRCTNLQHTLRYSDGSVTGLGWDNQRGVIRAIEEYLGVKIDEEQGFDRIIGDWYVHHVPWGAGLTVMRRKGVRS